MDIKVLEDFVHLTGSRSFVETALARNVSQSALSRRISALEEWVGARLFDRATYPISLTEPGEQILPMAIRIIEAAEEIRAAASSGNPDKEKSISMLVLSSLVAPVFMPLMAEFKAQGEDWNIRLSDTEPNFANNVKIFVEGKSDFLITFWSQSVAEMALIRNNAYHPIMKEKVLLVTRRNESGDPVWTLRDDCTVPYFSYSAASFLGQAVRSRFEQHAAMLTPVWENSLVIMLKSMVMTGEGVAWLPLSNIRAELASGLLMAIGGPETEIDIDIRIYRGISLPPYARRFWKSLGALLEAPQWAAQYTATAPEAAAAERGQRLN
ncbi:LysR family transcriptional regulator [Arvimicrobium flavum]|uniref:LysR family transcriptional regulator n=1 Tax=Arvimicrobium flavum TaxID=3393320 RepID=UPI00237AAAD2|nr:LysR family transcriptional regulator [Mesorhizobium shangrilense]